MLSISHSKIRVWQSKSLRPNVIIKNAQSLRNFMNTIDFIVALIKGLSGKRSGDLFLEIEVFASV